MTRNLERAIDLAEEYCGTAFGEARDDLAQVAAKFRSYDLLWERANTVIATFEALGRARSVPEQFTLHRRCESAMVALKETLNHEWPDTAIDAAMADATPTGARDE